MDEELTLEVRDARAADRDAVFAFCARTWGDDGDYIPRVWDSWLADTSGAVLAGIADGKPVAVSHISMLAPDEAWIEGLRVAPEARRKGAGRVIVSRSLIRAREMGASVARMFTGATNIASQRLFATFGFMKIAELAWYTGEALPNTSSVSSPAARLRTAAELDPTIAETTIETTAATQRASAHTGPGRFRPHLGMAGAIKPDPVQRWRRDSPLGRTRRH
jgi:N-acetylglutamate synthase-like GNAT family acetyltransferase